MLWCIFGRELPELCYLQVYAHVTTTAHSSRGEMLVVNSPQCLDSALIAERCASSAVAVPTKRRRLIGRGAR